jgi:hypothetical protein
MAGESSSSFKHSVFFVLVVVVGALLGSFMGNFLALMFPEGGQLQALFLKTITAGLPPARLDLKVAEFTFGFILKFNVTSVVGILLSAVVFKAALKHN